jgi:hypothetical protein
MSSAHKQHLLVAGQGKIIPKSRINKGFWAVKAGELAQ